MNKKVKILSVILAMGVLLGALTGCAPKQEEEKTAPYEEGVAVRIAGLNGPTGMGMVGMMKANEEKTTGNQYEFTLVGSPDEIVSKISTGEVDIAAVPTNLAAVLYNKTKGQVQMIATNTLGVLYILEQGDTIKTLADLSGKTIYATGQGTTPQYVLEYILKANGIDPAKDLVIEYKKEHAELATLASAGQVTIAMLPEPHVTAALSKNDNLRIALNLTEEWQKACALKGSGESELAMGCFIVRKEFADKNKEAVDIFLNEYKASSEFVTANAEEASQLIEKYGIIPKAAVALKALPNCNIVYRDGDGMKTSMEQLLKVFFEAEPKSVGGKMPNDDFYYKK